MAAPISSIRLRRNVAALLLAPVLLFAVSAFGYDGLRCQMFGIVEHCCCPKPERAPQQTTVSNEDCCAKFTVVVHKAPTEAPRGGQALVTTPAMTIISLLPATAPAERLPAVFTTTPVDGPPLLLVKQAFLL